ncbi:DAK2 domain-containing protein [Demequina sp. SO4-18]|uniref:DAK2 domain-containing protein n=1 Tax=Demequina sp. SO4-18 TaxID=3401026 RepID=UPI003B5C8B2B
MVSNQELRQSIQNCVRVFSQSADELTDLDQALGDGDLGITVSLGAQAVDDAVEALPDDADAVTIVRACAKAFANANPSTMAALVAGALLAGSRVLPKEGEIEHEQVGEFMRAAAESIGQRGKSQVGDKTILDAMVPAAEAFIAEPDHAEALHSAIGAATEGVQSSKALQSRKGRASWLQERSIGLLDPGAVGYQRFLEAWRDGNKGDS